MNFKASVLTDLGETVLKTLSQEKVQIGNWEVSSSFITGFIVTMFLLLFLVLFRIFAVPRFQKSKVPSKFQMFIEYMVTYFSRTTTDAVHGYANFLGPYVFTTATYIALTTLAELIGLKPTFSNVNACISFGLMTFFIIHFCGIKQNGIIKRGKRWLNPINIITDFSVPLSLSLRLFGAITSGTIIMELLYSMLYTSIVLPAVVACLTTLFHAFIQSYLFATLTNVFVSEALDFPEQENVYSS